VVSEVTLKAKKGQATIPNFNIDAVATLAPKSLTILDNVDDSWNETKLF
jgi:hypothetical protein